MADSTPLLELRTPEYNDQTLASLAYINVTWEDSRTSYFDNFVAFALEVMRASGQPLTQAEIADAIRSRFGLDFPTGVVGSIVGRAVRKRKAVRSGSGKTKLADGVADTLPDLTAEQASCRRQQNYLVNGLAQYAASQFELSWSDADAESALVEYIEAHAVPLLALSVSGRQYDDTAGVAQGRGYVVASYISDISDKNPAAFDYLDQMIKGSMLAAALYIEAPGDLHRRFRRTTLYLDTPICLRALGHEGPDARRASQKVLSLAAAQGAELACFEHTVREMRGILEGAKAALRSAPGAETGLRGVATHFRDAGLTTSDVDLAVQRLERDLEANRIAVRSTPAYTNELGLDEMRLEDVLQQRVGYKNEAARISDLKSLTAIHRLRGGESPPQLETCGAVLITNNASLVRASREFFDSGRHEWPIAMLDHDLAVLVWIKEPATAPDLPRWQVIADCYSALAPSAAMWSRIVDEVDRLSRKGDVTADDVILLRYSHEAERSLQDLTFGDPRRVSETAILKALARARDAAAAPAERARDEALQKAAEVEAQHAGEAFDLAQQTEENEQLRRRLEDLEALNTRREVQVREHVAGWARRLDMAATAVLLLLLIGSIVSGLVSTFPSVSVVLPQWLNWALRACAVVGLVAGGLILYFGKSLKEWKSIKLEGVRLTREKRALREAGLLMGLDATPDGAVSERA